MCLVNLGLNGDRSEVTVEHPYTATGVSRGVVLYSGWTEFPTILTCRYIFKFPDFRGSSPLKSALLHNLVI